jgi:hypothetical protein
LEDSGACLKKRARRKREKREKRERESSPDGECDTGEEGETRRPAWATPKEWWGRYAGLLLSIDKADLKHVV